MLDEKQCRNPIEILVKNDIILIIKRLNEIKSVFLNIYDNKVKHEESTKKLIKLHVADNGKGFDLLTFKDGIGLENIKRRAEMFSGKCKLKSSPGNGCELMVELPLKTVSVKSPEKMRLTANVS